MQHILYPSLLLMASQSVVTLNLKCRWMRIVGNTIFVTAVLGHVVFYFSVRTLVRQYQIQSLRQWLFWPARKLCAPLHACEDPSIALKVYQLPSDLSACYCWYDTSSVPVSFALDVIHCCSLPAKVVSARKISMQHILLNHWLCVWYS